MRTFIQLHDGIGFATIHADNEPDHSLTADNINAVEVFSSDPDQFLGKKYDEKTKTWKDAEEIIYAEIDKKGNIVEILKTKHPHLVKGPILTDDVEAHHSWIDGKWVDLVAQKEEEAKAETARKVTEAEAELARLIAEQEKLEKSTNP